MRVELNLGLILLVDDKSSLLSVNGDELDKVVSFPPPEANSLLVTTTDDELEVDVMSALEDNELR